MANQAAAADDEVSLAEIGQMLARQKWLIALIFIIIFAATAAYTFTRTPAYNMDMMLAVGEKPTLLGDAVEPIQTPAAVVSRIQEVLARQVYNAEFAESGLPRPSAAVADSAAGYIRLYGVVTIEQAEPFEALLEAVANEIVQEHEQKLNQRVAALQSQLTFLQEEIARLSQTVQPNGTHSEEISAAINLLADRILAQTRQSDRAAYERDRWQLEGALAASAPTEIVRSTMRSNTPEGPSARLLLTLGALLGLMVGMFAAIVRDLLKADAGPASRPGHAP
ncbi:hypothetical protein GH984_10320 [Spiribacter sp. C176]|uniref:Polysaccharide chain length determinant N-terminal domain-containing protein n=1 Tax=Spiribacter salilacus TaxID=2664894 RepID=A0A6N7QUR7_9GAMM|nr:Wzz/FepE/Etk N-terminal domain-containing protein [Spiribacter salilacus]MRH79093.1 hypothetical protein [Spiribacter salilacus]